MARILEIDQLVSLLVVYSPVICTSHLYKQQSDRVVNSGVENPFDALIVLQMQLVVESVNENVHHLAWKHQLQESDIPVGLEFDPFTFVVNCDAVLFGRTSNKLLLGNDMVNRLMMPQRCGIRDKVAETSVDRSALSLLLSDRFSSVSITISNEATIWHTIKTLGFQLWRCLRSRLSLSLDSCEFIDPAVEL